MVKKLINNTAGIILLPAAAAACAAFFRVLFLVSDLSKSFYFFIGGMIFCFLIRRILLKARIVYVLGHELTHALWCRVFGGRFSRLKISSRGGSVKLSSVNIWIILAPYFFPIYTILLGLAYGGLLMVFDIKKYYTVFLFIMGFSMQYHYLFTWDSLKIKQPDIKRSGLIIAAALIPLMNVFVLVLLLQFVIPELRIFDLWINETYGFIEYGCRFIGTYLILRIK